MDFHVIHPKVVEPIYPNMLGISGVIDDDRTIANDIKGLVGSDNDGCTFINADPQELRVFDDHTDKSIIPASFQMVLIDDRLGQKTEPLYQLDIVGHNGIIRSVLVFIQQFLTGDHEFTLNSGSGTGATDEAPLFIEGFDLRQEFGAKQQVGQATLVAA